MSKKLIDLSFIMKSNESMACIGNIMKVGTVIKFLKRKRLSTIQRFMFRFYKLLALNVI